MKIRQGFVSNSSSSSFVVAFPSQPQNEDEVFQMMFKESSPDDIFTCYDEKMSYKDIADRVFQDIQRQVNRPPEEDLAVWGEWGEENLQPKSLLEKIQKSFQNRYGYLDGSSVSVDDNGELVFHSYATPDTENYFGTKKGQLERCLKWEESLYQLWRERTQAEKSIREENGLVDPQYFYKDTEKGKKEVDIKSAENYKKLKKLPEWKKKQTEFRKKERYILLRGEVAQNKTAELDAKAFLKDNADAFILFTGYNDSCNGLMEHGQIFHNLSYVRISNH